MLGAILNQDTNIYQVMYLKLNAYVENNARVLRFKWLRPVAAAFFTG